MPQHYLIPFHKIQNAPTLAQRLATSMKYFMSKNRRTR